MAVEFGIFRPGYIIDKQDNIAGQLEGLYPAISRHFRRAKVGDHEISPDLLKVGLDGIGWLVFCEDGTDRALKRIAPDSPSVLLWAHHNERFGVLKGIIFYADETQPSRARSDQ